MPNVTLTIEPGTIIKGDKEKFGGLIVNKGGKLIANGTKTNPIVFTSAQQKGARRSGDWAGIVILGDSKINTVAGIAKMESIEGNHGIYGGENEADSSGELSFVRIEYAGQNTTLGAFNGLTLGAIGSGTKIENVQISFSKDDGIEFFGGTANAKNVVLYKNLDDDLDFTAGYTGIIENALVIRDPLLNDHTISRGIEIDGYMSSDDVDATKGYTTVTITNATMITFDSKMRGFGTSEAAVSVNKKANLVLNNSVIQNFNEGVKIVDNYGKKLDRVQADNVWIQSNQELLSSNSNDSYFNKNLKEKIAGQFSSSRLKLISESANGRHMGFKYVNSIEDVKNISNNIK